MVEILIAVAFLGVCAVSILDAVFSANGQASYAARRNLVVNVLKNEIEATRGLAANGTLVERSSSRNVSVAGYPSTVAINLTVSLQSGSTTLYDVGVRAEWQDETSVETRTESVTLKTVVRQP